MPNKNKRNKNKNVKNNINSYKHSDSNNRIEAKRAAAKRSASKRKGAFFRFSMVVICLVSGFGIIASLTFAFPVKSVKLYGQSVYTAEEVLSVAAIGQGQNVITLSPQKINERVTGEFPYIENVEVDKNINGTISLTVNPAKEEFCVISEGNNYIISTSGRVLTSSNQIPEGLPIIKGVFVEDITVGNKFSISDESMSNVYKTVTDNIRTYGFDCDLIDISDTVNITFRINEKIIVEIGSVTNINEKFKHLNSMLESIENDAEGIINLKLWSKNKPEGYFKSVSIQDYY